MQFSQFLHYLKIKQNKKKQPTNQNHKPTQKPSSTKAGRGYTSYIGTIFSPREQMCFEASILYNTEEYREDPYMSFISLGITTKKKKRREKEGMRNRNWE